jgi:hypothetical protein
MKSYTVHIIMQSWWWMRWCPPRDESDDAWVDDGYDDKDTSDLVDVANVAIAHTMDAGGCDIIPDVNPSLCKAKNRLIFFVLLPMTTDCSRHDSLSMYASWGPDRKMLLTMSTIIVDKALTNWNPEHDLINDWLDQWLPCTIRKDSVLTGRDTTRKIRWLRPNINLDIHYFCSAWPLIRNAGTANDQ